MRSRNRFTAQQRMKAAEWLQEQWASGARTKPAKCDVCGQTAGIIESHSEDYSAPFGDHIGRWGLCYRCYMILRYRFRHPTAFQAYCETLASGRRFPPMLTHDFSQFARDHLRGGEPPTEEAPEPPAGFGVILSAPRR